MIINKATDWSRSVSLDGCQGQNLCGGSVNPHDHLGLAGAHVNKCAISRGKAVSLWLKAGNLRDWLANRLGNRWPMNFIRNPQVKSFGRVASHQGN